VNTLAPPTAVIASQVLPATDVGHVADHESPDTVPAVVTTVPAGMLMIDGADVEADDRSRTVQLAA
jgi:hypothetical protein